jgi:class I fructose-bisphosphate aldolase
VSGQSVGFLRRMAHLFNPETGSSIIAALDHGIVGLPTGLEDVAAVLRSVLNANPDGVLLNRGIARQFAPELARRDGPALVLALDQVQHAGPRRSGPAAAHQPQTSVAEAMRLGADAVKTMLVMGVPAEGLAANMAYIATVAETCADWDLPLIVEPYLWGSAIPADPAERAELNADGARMAVELGADILKIEVGSSPEAFRAIVARAPVPTFVLGGPAREDPRSILEDVVAATEAGARGVTIGRNLWGYEDPARMVRAMSVAMASQDVERALRELEAGPVPNGRGLATSA